MTTSPVTTASAAASVGAASIDVLPDGAWPVMLTPFLAGSGAELVVDDAALDAYTDWLIEHGSAGLFPVALSGEMFELTEEVRLSIARRVVARSAGRVPVIASVAEAGTAESIAAEVAKVAETGVDAVVLIAALLMEESEDESGLQAKLRVILDLNPGVTFGIYECPLPYHRILSTEAVAWIAQTGRFTFFKETSHSVELMADRVAVSAGTPMKVYNAGIESLVESLAVGVSGLSGWVVNVYPEYVAWIVANATGADDAEALAVQAALDAVERGMGPTYPNSAKHLLAQRSALTFPAISRWRSLPINEAELDALTGGVAALELLTPLPGTAGIAGAASAASAASAAGAKA